MSFSAASRYTVGRTAKAWMAWPTATEGNIMDLKLELVPIPNVRVLQEVNRCEQGS